MLEASVPPRRRARVRRSSAASCYACTRRTHATQRKLDRVPPPAPPPPRGVRTGNRASPTRRGRRRRRGRRHQRQQIRSSSLLRVPLSEALFRRAVISSFWRNSSPPGSSSAHRFTRPNRILASTFPRPPTAGAARAPAPASTVPRGGARARVRRRAVAVRLEGGVLRGACKLGGGGRWRRPAARRPGDARCLDEARRCRCSSRQKFMLANRSLGPRRTPARRRRRRARRARRRVGVAVVRDELLLGFSEGERFDQTREHPVAVVAAAGERVSGGPPTRRRGTARASPSSSRRRAACPAPRTGTGMNGSKRCGGSRRRRHVGVTRAPRADAVERREASDAVELSWKRGSGRARSRCLLGVARHVDGVRQQQLRAHPGWA